MCIFIAIRFISKTCVLSECVLKLKIAIAIPASNEREIETDNRL